jgi:hypothetical protein
MLCVIMYFVIARRSQLGSCKDIERMYLMASQKGDGRSARMTRLPKANKRGWLYINMRCAHHKSRVGPHKSRVNSVVYFGGGRGGGGAVWADSKT